MKAILVTGAYGYIGRHVAFHLAQSGFSVAGIGHGEWASQRWREWGLGAWKNADVDLDQLLEHGGQPDAIIHCAGSGSVAASTLHPYQDYQRSVETTASLLEFVRLRAPNAAIVLASSAAVYGRAATLPISESAHKAPVSPYGSHKLVAETLCQMHARIFGTRIAIVRLFSVYGDGLKKQLLWDACSKAKRGESEFAGTGREQRDWVHVSDAAQLLALGVDHASADCPVVNGGSGVGTTVEQIVSQIFSLSGNRLTPTFSGSPRPGDPPGQIAAVERVGEWHWRPRIMLRDGVARYVEWFESNH